MDDLDPKDDELKEIELPEPDDDGVIAEDDDLLSDHPIKKHLTDDDDTDLDDSLDALAEEELSEEDSYDDEDKW